MPLKDYKDIFGEPNTGIHNINILVLLLLML